MNWVNWAQQQGMNWSLLIFLATWLVYYFLLKRSGR